MVGEGYGVAGTDRGSWDGSGVVCACGGADRSSGLAMALQ